MQQRHIAARFVELQFTSMYQCGRPKGEKFHYGAQEARELLDFIYGGPPTTDRDKIVYGTAEELKRAEELRWPIKDCG